MSKFKHGGHIRNFAREAGLRDDQIIDFSANINPLGPPEWLRGVVSSALTGAVHYPDPESSDLKRALARRYRVETDEILVGNGSTELIYLIPRAVEKQWAIVPVPSYLDYANAAQLAGVAVDTLLLKEEDEFRIDYETLGSLLEDDQLVYVGHPNNPTGLPLDRKALLDLAERNSSTLFVVDEAFLELSDGVESFLVDRPPNVVVVISLTKTYAIPGLRLGFAVADRELVARAEQVQPPWSVNRFAQAVGIAACEDTDYVERSLRLVGDEREFLHGQLQAIPGFHVYPGKANFLLARIDRSDIDAPELARRTLARGVALRVCDNFEGLDRRFFRVAVRSREDNLTLLESLKGSVGIAPSHHKKSRTPAIMVQGTSSNAGKSILTAALARILLQDGHRVAPFKCQNMSLNSFVTRDGGEMGRAQVVQAHACRLEPDVRMNPILLKPNSDTGSQVILLGKPVGNMNVTEYVRYKPTAFEAAKAAYDSLAEAFDVMVLEGAGSPAEVNLKHHDIVNMQMARYARSPVLLVGDIDRGGVFASFIGTMEVLAEWERDLVAGFVVNRFRGQEDLLDSAMEYTLRHTGRPVLGVVPYIQDLGLPEEDSVTFKSRLAVEPERLPECVEIAVIDVPHISNFTDFDAFRVEPDVRLKVIRAATDLTEPDAIILPGSKNVIGDLQDLRNRGIAERINELVRDGTSEVVGICGGLQMIGSGIEDPHGLESDQGTLAGLGFLELTTVLAPEKTLTRVSGTHLESGLFVYGYEIHHGRTAANGVKPVVETDRGEMDGARSVDGRIWGTYLHGIFDADEFRRSFIDRLRVRRGLAPLGKICGRYDLEPAFDRLAEVVRRSLPMDRIYALLGL
ncbi:MAG: cobyric acid synthase [Desulfomonile tiedjei]|nr:cobyric acid synthase [Desulfomonile tiedjei]